MEKLGFTPEEHDNMLDFYNRELKNNNGKSVLEFLFKDIHSVKLRRYFIDSLTKYVRYDSDKNCLENPGSEIPL